MTTGDEQDQDLYDTLGVPTGASGEDITRAYRRLARQQHPDTNPDAHAGAFADLTDAYDVLRDPTRRRAYDNTRSARAQAATSAAGTRIPVTHRPHEPTPSAAAGGIEVEPATIELVLTFEQAALGTTAQVPTRTETTCERCRGRGEAVGATACAACAGVGATTRTSGGINIRTTCQTCAGTGRSAPQPCDACRGTGRASRTRDVEIRIPAGVDDGTAVHIPLGGHRRAGTVAIVRVEPHRYFGRTGRDLTLRLPLTLAEAALGAVVTLPTLTGAVAVRIPAGTTHGRTLRVRGRGVPAAAGAGDLLATVEIVVPTHLNDQQRVALEAFAAATDSPRIHFEF